MHNEAHSFYDIIKMRMICNICIFTSLKHGDGRRPDACNARLKIARSKYFMPADSRHFELMFHPAVSSIDDEAITQNISQSHDIEVNKRSRE